jgi:hypothetical protein
MDKASGEKVAQQVVLEEKVFHGSEGYSSLLTNCLSGKGVCASSYV